MQNTLDKVGIDWKFDKKNDGSFFGENANHLPVLYFPLTNEAHILLMRK